VIVTAVPLPNQKLQTKAKRFNIEKWGWIYMRFSGVILVVLIFGHLFVNLVAGEGVKAIDFAFVAGKLANPFWIVWDTLLLWFALIHGANGMRSIINDYARNPRLRVLLQAAVGLSTAALLILGTLVLTTFDPCLGITADSVLVELCVVP
jgi:succinate dehydrogenase / fumarate reductase membrane anchor subunit